MNRDQGNFRGHPRQGPTPTATVPISPGFRDLLGRVSLADPAPELFDTTSEQIAKQFQDDGGAANKSTQIRRFYDEVTRYADRVRGMDEDHFAKILPFIRMINARVAYAAQRDGEGKKPLVGPHFREFMRHGLAQVNSVATLQTFRSLFEAVIGFSPRTSRN